MKKRIGALLTVLLLMALLAACGMRVSYSFDQEEFSIAEEQEFVLSYAEDLSEGSAWEYHFRGEAEFEIVSDARKNMFSSLWNHDLAKRQITIRTKNAGEGVVYFVRELSDGESDSKMVRVTVTPKKTIGTK